MSTLNADYIFEKTLSYNSEGKQIIFVLVGAGGNGGYLIPNLARQISIMNDKRETNNRTPHKLIVIDGDTVEDKNLIRQNFIKKDIHKNKAEVLSKRYGSAFSLDIGYIDQFLESYDMLNDILEKEGVQRKSKLLVLIGAVDNNKTRIILEKAHKEHGGFYLDGGNEESAGQVVLGYQEEGQMILPSVGDIYPEVLEAKDKLPTELSCAEAAVSAPQNVMTNILASTLMMIYLSRILNTEEDNGVLSHQVVFNATVPSFTTSLNKESTLNNYK